MSAILIEEKSYKIIEAKESLVLEAKNIYENIVVSICELSEGLVGLAVDLDSLAPFIKDFLSRCQQPNPCLLMRFLGGAKPVGVDNRSLSFYRSESRLKRYLEKPAYKHSLNYLAELKGFSKQPTLQDVTCLPSNIDVMGDGFKISINRVNICDLVAPVSVSISPKDPVLKTNYLSSKRKLSASSPPKETKAVSTKTLKAKNTVQITTVSFSPTQSDSLCSIPPLLPLCTGELPKSSVETTKAKDNVKTTSNGQIPSRTALIVT